MHFYLFIFFKKTGFYVPDILEQWLKKREWQNFNFWYVVLHFIESNKSFSLVYQNKNIPKYTDPGLWVPRMDWSYCSCLWLTSLRHSSINRRKRHSYSICYSVSLESWNHTKAGEWQVLTVKNQLQSGKKRPVFIKTYVIKVWHLPENGKRVD